MFFFDTTYMLIGGLGFLLSLAASGWVKLEVKKWSQVPMNRGMTGREVAQLILDSKGIRNVTIEQSPGMLSDHYDPSSRTLRLSPGNYGGRSIAAAGISAHEVGHAIQHAEGYWPMGIRQKMVPVANIGTNIGVWMVMIGMFMNATALSKLGVLLFAGFVIFTLVTLPVEIDASLRARKALLATGTISGLEARGVSSVLRAAAATYVAAALTAIMQLVYFAMRAGLLGRDDD
mgnify:CR=1 FL=1